MSGDEVVWLNSPAAVPQDTVGVVIGFDVEHHKFEVSYRDLGGRVFLVDYHEIKKYERKPQEFDSEAAFINHLNYLEKQRENAKKRELLAKREAVEQQRLIKLGRKRNSMSGGKPLKRGELADEDQDILDQELAVQELFLAKIEQEKLKKEMEMQNIRLQKGKQRRASRMEEKHVWVAQDHSDLEKERSSTNNRANISKKDGDKEEGVAQAEAVANFQEKKQRKLVRSLKELLGPKHLDEYVDNLLSFEYKTLDEIIDQVLILTDKQLVRKVKIKSDHVSDLKQVLREARVELEAARFDSTARGLSVDRKVTAYIMRGLSLGRPVDEHRREVLMKREQEEQDEIERLKLKNLDGGIRSRNNKDKETQYLEHKLLNRHKGGIGKQATTTTTNASQGVQSNGQQNSVESTARLTRSMSIGRRPRAQGGQESFFRSKLSFDGGSTSPPKNDARAPHIAITNAKKQVLQHRAAPSRSSSFRGEVKTNNQNRSSQMNLNRSSSYVSFRDPESDDHSSADKANPPSSHHSSSPFRPGAISRLLSNKISNHKTPGGGNGLFASMKRSGSVSVSLPTTTINGRNKKTPSTTGGFDESNDMDFDSRKATGGTEALDLDLDLDEDTGRSRFWDKLDMMDNTDFSDEVKGGTTTRRREGGRDHRSNSRGLESGSLALRSQSYIRDTSLARNRTSRPAPQKKKRSQSVGRSVGVESLDRTSIAAIDFFGRGDGENAGQVFVGEFPSFNQMMGTNQASEPNNQSSQVSLNGQQQRRQDGSFSEKEKSPSSEGKEEGSIVTTFFSTLPSAATGSAI